MGQTPLLEAAWHPSNAEAAAKGDEHHCSPMHILDWKATWQSRRKP